MLLKLAMFVHPSYNWEEWGVRLCFWRDLCSFPSSLWHDL